LGSFRGCGPYLELWICKIFALVFPVFGFKESDNRRVLRLYCYGKLPYYRFFEMAAKLRKRGLGNRFLYLLKIPLDYVL
jgi:hypothetical protein